MRIVVRQLVAGMVCAVLTFALAAPAAATIKPLIYLTGEQPDYVYAYDQGKFKLQYLFSLTNPTGIAVDQSANLYVTNFGSGIGVYAPGSMSPFESLSNPGMTSTAVAVAADGTVYAVNYFYEWQRMLAGSIAVYGPGKLVPDYTLPLPGAALIACVAVDANKNVYVLYGDLAGDDYVREFAASSRGASTNLGLALPKGFFGWGIIVDTNGNLLVTDVKANAIDVFPPGATQPSTQIAQGTSARYMAFTSDGSELWVAGYNTMVYKYAYPAGTLLAEYKEPPGGVSGLATSPAAPF
jgi:hypothetical protein